MFASVRRRRSTTPQSAIELHSSEVHHPHVCILGAFILTDGFTDTDVLELRTQDVGPVAV
jgi:hypothetical protein